MYKLTIEKIDPQMQIEGRLDDHLAAVRKVVSASRYTDMYRELDPELLHAIIRIKAHRCLRGGEVDVEELVDIAAYAALLRLRVANSLLSATESQKPNSIPPPAGAHKDAAGFGRYGQIEA